MNGHNGEVLHQPVTNENMKYIVVTGGVISGVGKGIIASSFGTILKSCGLSVTSIKIDPYINIDAGTFSPYEHGEVYVLDDGSEVDLDLGNYERFLDATLHAGNNITTGKIYQKVIEAERNGEYLGKTVQVVPHITDAIQKWVVDVANTPVTNDGRIPDVCVIELGGTIGDIEGMPFIEAIRQLQFRLEKENFCLAHVSLIPQPKCTGEHKTKPTQSSVRELRSLGLLPDIIVCRSETEISDDAKEKISNFCNVPLNRVVCIRDVNSVYEVPLLMESRGIIKSFDSILHLNKLVSNLQCNLNQWRNLAFKAANVSDEVNIGLVGKYTKLEDSYASVSRALQHACLAAGYKLKLTYIEADHLESSMLENENDSVLYDEAWKKLKSAQGVVVPGGFGERGIEGKIMACKMCRENNIPFLGICLGFQVAVIEFARNVLSRENANSSEFVDLSILKKDCSDFIIDMPEHNTGVKGGTQRLGKRKTFFVPEYRNSSVLYKLYGNREFIEERHRHRKEVNRMYAAELQTVGMHFVGVDNLEHPKRMQILELHGHPYYVATQFHPEYLTRPLRPSPPFLGLIMATGNKEVVKAAKNSSIKLVNGLEKV